MVVLAATFVLLTYHLIGTINSNSGSYLLIQSYLNYSPSSSSDKENEHLFEGINLVLDELPLQSIMPHLFHVSTLPTTHSTVCKSVTICIVVSVYVVSCFFVASFPFVTQGVMTAKSVIFPCKMPQNCESGILYSRICSSFQ